MKKYDITIVCQKEYYQPKDPDDYVKAILLEDKLVMDALESIGLSVTRTYWDNPNFDFSNTKAILFRAIWDYFNRFSEFEAWLKIVERKTQLINPSETIHWNIDKHYLLDLQKADVNIVETEFIEPGTKGTLKSHFNNCPWDKAILKPAISGAARHTYVIEENNLDQYEKVFRELIKTEAMMLQPFIASVLTKGEVSHMAFGGHYSHSVLKKVKKGDFRVQDDFGGSLHEYHANENEKAFVEKVLKACKPMPTYARVDVLWDNQGDLALAELEVIEPELWFRRSNSSAGLLAKAIKEEYFK